MKKAILQLGSCVVVGLVADWLAGNFHSQASLAYLFRCISQIALTIPEAIAIGLFFIIPHELGHILAGNRLGFRTVSVRALGFTLSRYGNRWQLNWQFSLFPLVHRWTYCERPNIEAYQKVLLTGPIVSVLMAVVASPLLAFPQLQEVGAFLVGGHLLYALCSFIGSTEDNQTDGRRLKVSRLKPREVEKYLIKQNESIVRWQRPRSYDLSKMTPKNDVGHDLKLSMLWYWKLMDQGQILEAEPHITRALELASRHDSNSEYVAEAVYESATYFRRFRPSPALTELADELCQKFAPDHEKKLMVEGAKLWTQGKKQEAKEVWRECDANYQSKVINPGDKAHGRDWFLRLKNEDIVFETDRLFARTWRIEDVEPAFNIYRDPEVVKYLGRDPKPIESIEEMRGIVERRLEAQKNWEVGKGFWALVRKEDEKLIGAIMCKHPPDADGNLTEDVEIGWHLGKEYWGQGYATEAALAVAKYGFQMDLKIDRLIAVIYEANFASKRVATNLDMKMVGKSSKYYGVELEVYEVKR